MGRCYAHAGAFMRVGQTNMELPAETVAFTNALEREWPYAEYAIQDEG